MCLEVLGAVDNSVFSQLFRAAVEGRAKDCISAIEEIVIQGRELSQFVTDFIWYLRNLLIVQSADDAENILDTSMENLRQLKEEAALTDGNTLMRYIRIFSELSGQMRYASQKRVLLEIAFIKLTKPSMEQNLDSVLQRISELEARIARFRLRPSWLPWQRPDRRLRRREQQAEFRFLRRPVNIRRNRRQWCFRRPSMRI